jgi:hypothetical protein
MQGIALSIKDIIKTVKGAGYTAKGKKGKNPFLMMRGGKH